MVTRYAVIVGGQVVNVVQWDGDTSNWQPPQGATCVPFDPAVHAITLPPDMVNQQAIRDALATAVTYFGGNYTGWATMTNTQKDTAARNAQRALGQIARWLLGQFDSAG